MKIESSTDEFSPLHLLRLGADLIFGLFLASVSVMALVSSLALSPFIRALHRRRFCTRVSDRPHTLLILGYTTLAEAEQKGILSPAGDSSEYNSWYNPGGFFQRVIVYIPSGRDNRRLRLTEEIEYREDGSVLSQFRPQLRFVPKPLRFLRTAFATLNTVLSEPVDVVQVNGPNIPSFPAAFIKIMTGVPCVVFIEAFWELLLPFQSYMKTWQRKWLLLWYRLVYRLFDAYVGGPSLQPEMYIRRGMAPHRIWPFLNNVEVGKLVEDAENALFPVEMATIPKPRIVTVGRLIGEKLTTDAIEVMAALDSMGITAQTVLIGDGPLREELRTLAANLGVADRVHLLGFRPLAEAMAAVKECDLYFAPYQGNALVEAMALGCPIVAYDNEPHREFLTPNKTGVMVPHRDVEAAAVALAELLENPERARALGSEAKAEVFRRYTEDNIVNTWIAPFIAVYARSCGR